MKLLILQSNSLAARLLTLKLDCTNLTFSLPLIYRQLLSLLSICVCSITLRHRGQAIT